MNGLHHQTAKVEQENENTINLVDSDSDSSLSELESETHSEDDGGDDSDDRILRPGLYALGLNKHYVPTWKSKDAFREFYQNWLVWRQNWTSKSLILAGKTRSLIHSTWILDLSHRP